jgi:hypothetical protein
VRSVACFIVFEFITNCYATILSFSAVSPGGAVESRCLGKLGGPDGHSLQQIPQFDEVDRSCRSESLVLAVVSCSVG